MASLRTLEDIKNSITKRIQSCPENPINLHEALEIIKISIEDVIRFSGVHQTTC